MSILVLDLKKSDELRDEYIKSFIDTSSSYYKEDIEQKTLFSDGFCYIGYLWDCLLKPTIISEYKANHFLEDKGIVYIMWDIHSSERIFIDDYWKFPKNQILCTDEKIESLKSDLPEDIYVFDDTFSWTVVFTHEYNDKDRRYCLFMDANNGVII